MSQTLPKVANVEMTSEIKLTINTTPEASEAAYEDMGAAFKDISTAVNEVVYTATYLSDGGFSSSAVVGAAPTITLNGDYIKNDPVCQYLSAIQYAIGASRVTDVKLIQSGRSIVCPVTITSLQISGGSSNAPNSISVTLTFNGKPVVTNSAASLSDF